MKGENGKCKGKWERGQIKDTQTKSPEAKRRGGPTRPEGQNVRRKKNVLCDVFSTCIPLLKN
jgi:hypothetical protein